MKAEFTIKAALESDAGIVAELERACFSEPWSEQSILSCMGDTSYIFFIVSSGARAAGYGSMRYILDEAEICNIAVYEYFRRRGAASAILEQMLKAAHDLQLKSIHLEVRASNCAAISLYEKYGFKQSGVRRAFYQKPREDAVLMTKQIDNMEDI